jgi:hypothetical protein
MPGEEVAEWQTMGYALIAGASPNRLVYHLASMVSLCLQVKWLHQIIYCLTYVAIVSLV